jgi:tetratricopeptide (TPR) repeat protein
MARKKRKAKSESHRRTDKSESAAPPPLHDIQAMEGVLQQLVAKMVQEGVTELPGPLPDLDSPPPRSAVDAAQQIAYQAFEAETPRQKIALARKALQVSRDCADAYTLLAENARTLDEALELYEEAVAAGERALGKQAFEEYEGHFWGFLETRPYMRARQGLANILWTAGRHVAATEHYRDMLRLNPNDNQGMRYMLAHALLDAEQHHELHGLLKQYEKDPSADWAYAAALLAFREQGSTEHSRALLKQAAKTNKHVPVYLTGAKRLPRELPEYFSPGHENEAVGYVAQCLPCWRNTPGATTWIRTTLKVPVAAAAERRRPHWGQLKTVLAGLTQAEDEVWEVDVRPCSAPLDYGGAQVKPWMVLTINATEEAILDLEILFERPPTTAVWQRLVEAMRKPTQGEPRRPGRIHVRLKTFQSAWQSKLEQVGIDCRQCNALAHVDRIMEDTGRVESMAQRLLPSSDVTPDAPGTDIAELPQNAAEIWQADVRLLPAWINVGGQPHRPWVTLVANVTDDLILATDLDGQAPEPNGLWRALQSAIERPAAGAPHRPGVVQLTSPEHHERIEPRLRAAGVRCVLADRLEEMDFIAEDLATHMAGPARLKPILDSPAVTLEQVGSFFDAAADFYRAAPWRDIPGDTPIKIECEKLQSGPWYAIVMGQLGMELGLALYEDPNLLRALLAGSASDDENSRRTSGLSVTYGEAFDIAPRDLDAAERHGWTVAGPEAYPCVMRINPGLALRPPLVWELELLEACLRLIPKFAEQSATEYQQAVPVASGDLPLRLSLVDAL